MFFNYKTKPNTFNQSSVIYSVIAVTITLEKLEETLTLRRMSILTSRRNQNQQNIHPILNNQLELPFLSLFCHGITEPICDVLRNLIHLYNLKNVKNTHGGVKHHSSTDFFSHFLYSTNGKKPRKASHLF